MKEAILFLSEKHPALSSVLDELTKSLQTKDHRQSVELVLRLASVLSSVGNFAAFAKLLGAPAWERLKKQLLIRLAARAIPFVGPLYTTAAILTVAYLNMERLTTAASCGRK